MGGEESVVAAESRLLRHYGHEVEEYTEDNQRIEHIGHLQTLTQLVWSLPTQRRLGETLGEFRPDIVHFHNTFPLISPAAYYTCRRASIPVVQTLHNYRLLCPAANFLRNSHVCELCLGKTPPMPAILHKCYRRSSSQSAAVAAMLTIHRLLQTWQKRVDCYIALSEFARAKFCLGGLPEHKMHVKPNFVFPDPGVREQVGDFALFVGRISEEKGIWLLLDAWRHLRNIPLNIVGHGPLSSQIQEAIQSHGMSQVRFMGKLPHEDVLTMIKQARLVVVPSICYENFPLAIAEAFACGIPVVAANIGSIGEIVEHEKDGLLFKAGSTGDLVAQLETSWNLNAMWDTLGRSARTKFEHKYSAEANYEQLMDIYAAASGKAR